LHPDAGEGAALHCPITAGVSAAFVSSSPAGVRQPLAAAGFSPVARLLLIPRLVKQARELLGAGVAGAFGTGIDLGALVLLVGHHVPIALATFIATLAGAATNFTLNKYVAFHDRSPLTLAQVVRFDVVAVIAALLMAAAMKIATATLGLPVVAAKLACAAVVFVIWTYPAQRRLVFVRGAVVV
jgi:putative flippase GtrA